MKTFRILCIDGGGIKGLYSAQVLADFEKEYKTLITHHFDMICGTSTGGLIAIGASLGIPMEEIVRFYDTEGPKIFREDIKRRFFMRLGIGDAVLSIKQALWSSKYDGTRLESSLHKIFGDKTLEHARNILCIPAFNITDARIKVFRNGVDSRDMKMSLLDVALATASAPTYFPIQDIGDQEFIDGALWANNPMMVGLYIFMNHYLKPWEDRGESDYYGAEILSISSCEKFIGQKSSKRDRSFLRWKDSIFDIYSDSQGQANDMLLDKLRSHMDFTVRLTRVTNMALAAEEARHISMDCASYKTRQDLKRIGSNTAKYYISNPEVRRFFTNFKTLQS